ncbi:hypothetical protein DZA50_02105 [Kangiella sp. HD9-110m-PIT-SAG07]|nr:hypothetical protein DZA50_02105 [Kangiella sp. HD9-110m-PIT-SAG07]
MKVLGFLIATSLLLGCSSTPHFVAEQTSGNNDGVISATSYDSRDITWGGVVANIEEGQSGETYNVTVVKTILEQSMQPRKSKSIANIGTFRTSIQNKSAEQIEVGQLVTVLGKVSNSASKDRQVTTSKIYVWNKEPIYKYFELPKPYKDPRGNLISGFWECTDCNNKRTAHLKTDSSLRERFHDDARPKSEPPYEIIIDTSDY